MALNAGSIYAEAELNVERFLSAAGELEGASERIAAAMAGSAASAESAAQGILGYGDAVGMAASQAGAEGARLAQSYAEGISAGAGAARAGAAAMAAGAVSAARSGLNGAAAIGRNFSAGIAAGIRAGQSGVISAAISVAQAAAAAARSALAIHSPSRVTEELGEFFDLGFIRGVEGMTPEIQDAIRAAVHVEPPAGAAYGGNRETSPAVRVSGPAMDYDALAEAMDRREVALYMNDRRMARIMAHETARAQGMRSRSIALGYGK